jgi:tellurite methyltransferase
MQDGAGSVAMNYDETYGRFEDFFGTEPTEILVRYCDLLRKDAPVLDVGAGQGRNSLFLARKGFHVDAIDPSKVSVEAVSLAATKESLPVRAHLCGFETFAPDVDSYSGILLFGLLQILSRQSLDLLRKKVTRWTAERSLLFVTAFTTGDPSYRRSLDGLEGVGKNSFVDGEGNVRTYLEPGEILTLFPGFTAVYHHEGMGAEHTHGGRPPHRHYSVEAVLRR